MPKKESSLFLFFWIASSYDELGNRSQITSSLGAKIDVACNEMGNVSQITASRSEQKNWTASMQYNELGQEIERILPGDVISKWQYDVAGRPTHHRISSQGRHTRRRVYNWDVNHRLRSMVNELTGVKVTFGYDEFSNLVWSNLGGQFDFLHRSVDDVGNLYETKEKTDRVYGTGSRLLETREATFTYDDEGNLIQKVEKNGDTWKYEYKGNGMMSKVIRADNTEVTFKYDSMGRRIEKSFEGKTTHFVWDDNTILHEWSEGGYTCEFSITNTSTNNANSYPNNLVTWIFEPNTFIPSAKITSEGNYSIISDYLGTPVEAYDMEGKQVWSSELNIYGRAKEFTGENDFVPFRYQGQYEDAETGLYYNRFRYYSPSEGIYTQVDPIGLAGNNPTLYGYVSNTNIWVDPLGLINWSDILRKSGIPMPPGLTNPHGHHIVFKGFFKGEKGQIIKESKKILEKYNIDVVHDRSNLMWASNTEGVHTKANAKKVLRGLQRVDKVLQNRMAKGLINETVAQAMMKDKLQSIGKIVFCKY